MGWGRTGVFLAIYLVLYHDMLPGSEKFEASESKDSGKIICFISGFQMKQSKKFEGKGYSIKNIY